MNAPDSTLPHDRRKRRKQLKADRAQALVLHKAVIDSTEAQFFEVVLLIAQLMRPVNQSINIDDIAQPIAVIKRRRLLPWTFYYKEYRGWRIDMRNEGAPGARALINYYLLTNRKVLMVVHRHGVTEGVRSFMMRPRRDLSGYIEALKVHVNRLPSQ